MSESAVATAELLALSGLTARQVNHLYYTNRLRVVGWDGERNPPVGQGYDRAYPVSEVAVMCTVRRLLDAGFILGRSVALARELAEGATGVTLTDGLRLIDLDARRRRRALGATRTVDVVRQLPGQLQFDDQRRET